MAKTHAVRKRLDALLVEKGLVQSRERARALILAGKIQVDGLRVDKAGAQVSVTSQVSADVPDFPYVSRGALKLEAALNHLALDVKGMVCMDVGASTGGFTDLLLQRGAARVFAVDVGYGQLAWTLRQDPRVVTIERMNIRHMPQDAVDVPMDLITIDTSFISLRLVVPAVRKFLKKDARILALVKPQFEVGKGEVGKGGVVRDPELQARVVTDLRAFFTQQGFFAGRAIASPIQGPKGNQEFILPLWTQAERQKMEDHPESVEPPLPPEFSGLSDGPSLPSGSHEGDV